MVTFGISGRKNSTKTPQYFTVADGLQDIYAKLVRPVEDTYLFENFHSPPLTKAEIAARPNIMLIGQYSTGKTSFIQHLLGRDYPGAHIGPEPTTDRFVAVTFGEEEKVVPGNAAVAQSDQPFGGLAKFGSSFLSKFQVSESPAALLDSVTFIDTPGVLSGDKQRLGRAYDFVKVCQWFAQRSDMIILLFDAHKLDISDELKDVISVVKENEDKIRIVLNKADQISNQQLMRVYGALMWSLGKIIQTPEVVRVYIGSFWIPLSPVESENSTLLKAEQIDLLNELHNLPKNAAVRKINEMIKRAKQVKVHAILISHLREQMPSLFGKGAKQTKLIANLNAEFTKVQQIYKIPSCDFPDYEQFREVLLKSDISQFPRINSKLIEGLEEALAIHLPDLLKIFSAPSHNFFSPSINPFSGQKLVSPDEPASNIDSDDKLRYVKLFRSQNLENGKITGDKARDIFKASGLSEDLMATIWDEADQDRDGRLTESEFIKAMRLMQIEICKREQ